MNKYILIAVIALVVISGGICSAEMEEEFKDFPRANIDYNGKSIQGEVPAINFYGNVMIPIRQMGRIFEAVVNWDADTKTVKVLKPHIDMILCDYYGEAEPDQEAVVIEDQYGRSLLVDKIIGNPFSKFEVGTYSFNAYFDVSGLEPGGEYVDRVIIIDPDNNLIYNTNESEAYTLDENQSGYIYTLGFESVHFGKPGIYSFQFQFKSGGNFVTVYSKDVEVY